MYDLGFRFGQYAYADDTRIFSIAGGHGRLEWRHCLRNIQVTNWSYFSRSFLNDSIIVSKILQREIWIKRKYDRLYWFNINLMHFLVKILKRLYFWGVYDQPLESQVNSWCGLENSKSATLNQNTFWQWKNTVEPPVGPYVWQTWVKSFHKIEKKTLIKNRHNS